MAEELAGLEGKPWAEWGRTGKPISKNQLARQLNRFKISPDSIRIGETHARGYFRSQFEPAWKRYLDPGEYKPQQRDNDCESKANDTFQTGTEKTAVPVAKDEKSLGDNDCPVATVENAENGPSDEKNEEGSLEIAPILARRPNGRNITHNPENRRDPEDEGLMSNRAIDQVAREVEDWASNQHRHIDQEELETEIERRLAGYVSLDAMSAEVERVMRAIFPMPPQQPTTYATASGHY